MNPDYDIIVIGGGLVGASLACALGGSGLRVAVVEAVPLGALDQPSYDDRTIALAWGSRRIFEGLGVWRAMGEGVCPIRHIHISDRGHFGMTHLDADEAGLEALGYVVENRVIGEALYAALQTYEKVELISPASVTGLEQTAESVSCRVEQEGGARTLTARLAVVADGGRSGIAESLGLRVRRTDYGQTAIVTNVTPGRDHAHTAYERFTDTGPLALLPMTGSRCAVVWSARHQEVDTILGWDEAEFLARLQQRFGHRLGEFRRAGKRAAYPLALTRLREHVRGRTVLVGNAAHTVHPVAGQGFNLGLRDVATLAEVLVQAQHSGEDIGEAAVLHRYTRWRRRDTLLTSAFTDALIRIFSNNFPPLVLARDLGLLGVELLPGVKRAFTRRTSGLHGKLPRLARGVSLIE